MPTQQQGLYHSLHWGGSGNERPQTILERGKVFILLACVTSVYVRRACSAFWPRANWSGVASEVTQSSHASSMFLALASHFHLTGKLGLRCVILTKKNEINTNLSPCSVKFSELTHCENCMAFTASGMGINIYFWKKKKTHDLHQIFWFFITWIFFFESSELKLV